MSPRAVREQLKVSKDQGPRVKSILRKLVFKKLILQKGNLFAHIDLQTGDQYKKKKSFENPRLRYSKKPSIREAKIVEGRFIATSKGLVLSILAKERVMFSYPRGIRMGLWMETWLRFEPLQNPVMIALEDTFRKYFNVQPVKCWQD